MTPTIARVQLQQLAIFYRDRSEKMRILAERADRKELAGKDELLAESNSAKAYEQAIVLALQYLPK